MPDEDLASEPVNILLVDDQPEGLLALEAVLEDLGQNLVKASTGAEALRRLLADDFAVILLDVQMPLMDGYETARYIRARPRCRHTPIIFLTAGDKADAQMIRGYAVGAVDYMFKPLEATTLRSKVSVFVELAKKNDLIQRQSAELRRSEQAARELAAARAGLLVDLENKNLELESARARAERESQFKSSFLAGMSHELRTPLNAIIGFTELLEQEIAGPLAPTQHEYVGHVLQSGRHLLSLVNDFLDLSKIEAGRMELRREWIAPAVVVDAVRGAIAPLALKQGVTVEIDLPELPDLYVDAVRLRQVLYNLLSNAIKFTPRGGWVQLRATSDPTQLVLSVADSGIGIRSRDLPRLFREFEQLDAGGGHKPEGTGLGLALTKRLVELHGGTVDVASEPGEGSTFTVILPRVAGPPGPG